MINVTMIILLCCSYSSLMTMAGNNNQTLNPIPTGATYIQIAPSFSNAAVAQNTNTIYTEINTKITNAIEMMQKTVNNIPHDLQGWLDSHKWHLAIGTPIATYALICSFLIYGNRYMNDEKTWARWKRHLSPEELNAYCLDEQKKQELSNNLIDTILKRYFKTKEPTNHIDPLIQFTTDIEQEIKFLTRYIIIGTIIQKSQLIKIFPTNDIKIEQAKEYRQRLQFIKQLFINSMATYNLQQFLTSTKVPSVPAPHIEAPVIKTPPVAAVAA